MIMGAFLALKEVIEFKPKTIDVFVKNIILALELKFSVRYAITLA
jgi:hypothetical protein